MQYLWYALACLAGVAVGLAILVTLASIVSAVFVKKPQVIATPNTVPPAGPLPAGTTYIQTTTTPRTGVTVRLFSSSVVLLIGKILLYLLLAVAVITGILFLYDYFRGTSVTPYTLPAISLPSWKDTFFGIELWLLVLGLTILGMIAWVTTTGSLSLSRVSSSVRANPKIFTVIWVVLLLYALCLAFFPEWRDALLTPRALGLLFMALVGYATFVVIKAVFWETSKLTAIILMFLLIAVLDVGITRHIPEGTLGKSSTYQKFSRWWNKPSSDGQYVTRSPDRNPCDRVIRRTRVGSDGVVVNPGGACTVSFQVMSGRLFFHGPEGSTGVWYPGRAPMGEVRKRIVTAYAVTPDAEVEYLLCPAGMDGTGWYCH